MEVSPHLISLIAISKRRKQVLLELEKYTMSQPELRKITGMYKSHISRTIKELLSKNLIACRNPKDKAFRFYKITSLGKKVINEVERIIN